MGTVFASNWMVWSGERQVIGEFNNTQLCTKNTKIDDRLMLPTPERTEEEQEWNRFQVLVGETHAGNNSPELIKELKGLLLKMAHTNRLPKGQVREILMDLTAMGH